MARLIILFNPTSITKRDIITCQRLRHNLINKHMCPIAVDVKMLRSCGFQGGAPRRFIVMLCPLDSVPPPPPLPYPGGLSSINSLCEENDNYIVFGTKSFTFLFRALSPVCLCFKAPNDTNISPSNH